MIRVGLDTSILAGPSGERGIGRYTRLLLQAFQSSPEIRIEEIKNPREIHPENFDLVHYPYFDFFFSTLPFFKKRKTLVTVHDCTPLVFPRKYPPGIKGKWRFWRQKLSLKTVSLVVTDSQASRKDIERFLGVPRKKIRVVYLTADPIYQKVTDETRRAEIKKKYGLPVDFLLYVGDVNYNKNLPGLVKAFSQIENKNLSLVFVGKAFENEGLPEVKKLHLLIKELRLGGRVKILGFVKDEDLVVIYNLAKVYCQPSLYEGFGVQILEAMACGCPVVTTKISSPPEVAGEAALLVEPASITEIAEGIKRVIGSQFLREKMIAAGLKRVKDFSLEKMVGEMTEIYRECLSSK